MEKKIENISNDKFSGKEIMELKLNTSSEFALNLVDITMFLGSVGDIDHGKLNKEKANAKNLTDKELIEYVNNFNGESEDVDLEKCLAIDMEIKKRTDLSPKRKELKI